MMQPHHLRQILIGAQCLEDGITHRRVAAPSFFKFRVNSEQFRPVRRLSHCAIQFFLKRGTDFPHIMQQRRDGSIGGEQRTNRIRQTGQQHVGDRARNTGMIHDGAAFNGMAFSRTIRQPPGFGQTTLQRKCGTACSFLFPLTRALSRSEHNNILSLRAIRSWRKEMRKQVWCSSTPVSI